jgi:leader peptidase (prepilin peptidase)/N-methyltransferase
MKSGLDEQEAFNQAALKIGQAGSLKSEFTKVDGTQRKLVWLLLTGIAFASCWMQFGRSPAVALVYCVLLAGLIAAAFIDFKYLIIPDKITIGGIVVGLVCSVLLPQLHEQKLFTAGMLQSMIGICVGAGLLYLILRMGKLLYGHQRVALPDKTKIIFTKTALRLPEKEIPYEELFYRKSDAIEFHAHSAECENRSYRDVPIRLTASNLRIGGDNFSPEDIPHMEAIGSEVVLPREAMGFGDVKFMAAIGAFLGWQAVIFSLIVSSLIGSLAGIGLVAARRREWSARLPYGPYIALAAVIWIFGGKYLFVAMFAQ